jgi:tRNA modification GTPase
MNVVGGSDGGTTAPAIDGSEQVSRDETIFALSTAPGRAGIAVIRVSGSDAGGVLDSVTGRPRPDPRRAVRRRLCVPRTGEKIDDGLVIWFPGPASATGEDLAEFHVHGGRAVIAALQGALASCKGVRMAEPGEFTRRAFLNGKVDLTQAEAVDDIVTADTEEQRRQAVRQLEGDLGRTYEAWRRELVSAQAWMEALIDFSEEDLPDGVAAQAFEVVDRLITEMSRHLEGAWRGERLRDGVRVVIAGAPNVGKSSLLNRLARREAAIVSNIAGTTRDVVEVNLDLGGYPVIVSDTAGLRSSGDVVEREGVRRAVRTIAESDIRIAMYDGVCWPVRDENTDDHVDGNTMVVVNKIDLVARRQEFVDHRDGGRVYAISAQTGDGIADLEAELAARVRNAMTGVGTLGPTRERHREAVARALGTLKGLMATRDGETKFAESPELVAEDLRVAAKEIGRVVGRVDVEDILDVVFREFCIGK